MPLIDRSGECSVVELETWGFCLPDEPADALGVVEVPLQFFAYRAQNSAVASGAEQASLGIKLYLR